MRNDIPVAYLWFSKLNLTTFLPWRLDSEIDFQNSINEQYSLETNGNNILTFAYRKDQDTCAGFEIVGENITGRVIVFHPSYQKNISGWNIIENEYSNFFEFIKINVLVEMEEWIKDEDIED